MDFFGACVYRVAARAAPTGRGRSDEGFLSERRKPRPRGIRSRRNCRHAADASIVGVYFLGACVYRVAARAAPTGRGRSDERSL